MDRPMGTQVQRGVPIVDRHSGRLSIDLAWVRDFVRVEGLPVFSLLCQELI